jgi:hypothetical protein
MTMNDPIRDDAGARRARSRTMTVNGATGRVEEGGETVAEGSDDDWLRSVYHEELAHRREHGDAAAVEEIAVEEEPQRRPTGDVGQGPRGRTPEEGRSFEDVLRAAARGESAHSWRWPFDWSGS